MEELGKKLKRLPDINKNCPNAIPHQCKRAPESLWYSLLHLCAHTRNSSVEVVKQALIDAKSSKKPTVVSE